MIPEQDIKEKMVIARGKGNEYFAYFKSSDSKSRKNFQEMLQGEKEKYVLNEYARQYLENQPLALKYKEQLIFSDEPVAEQKKDWEAYLLAKEIVSPKTVQMLSEAALLGGVMAQDLSEPLRIRERWSWAI